jgi:hypothetical protein
MSPREAWTLIGWELQILPTDSWIPVALAERQGDYPVSLKILLLLQ